MASYYITILYVISELVASAVSYVRYPCVRFIIQFSIVHPPYLLYTHQYDTPFFQNKMNAAGARRHIDNGNDNNDNGINHPEEVGQEVVVEEGEVEDNEDEDDDDDDYVNVQEEEEEEDNVEDDDVDDIIIDDSFVVKLLKHLLGSMEDVVDDDSKSNTNSNNIKQLVCDVLTKVGVTFGVGAPMEPATAPVASTSTTTTDANDGDKNKTNYYWAIFNVRSKLKDLHEKFTNGTITWDEFQHEKTTTINPELEYIERSIQDKQDSLQVWAQTCEDTRKEFDMRK